MLKAVIKVARQNPETRKYLVPLIRQVLAEDQSKTFSEFLSEVYDMGHKKVPNPNPETREQFPDVELNTAIKYRVGDSRPVWDKVWAEFQAWKEAPEKAPEPKAKTPGDEIQSGSQGLKPGESFTRKIIPKEDPYWKIEKGESILNAKTTFGNKKLEKFSWNPVTGEFLMIYPGKYHASEIGKAPFGDYVRGIVLHDKNEVVFRAFRPTWLGEQEASIAQQFHGDGGEHKAIMNSLLAQDAAEDALKKDGAKGWKFRQNVTNKMLAEETGYTAW